MSAAVVSTSVMGSAATMIHLGRWRQTGPACGPGRGRSGHWRRTAARRTGTAHILGAVRPRGSCARRGSPAAPGPVRAPSGRATTRAGTRSRSTGPPRSRCRAAPPAGRHRANAAIDSTNSVRRCRHSRTVPGMSASDSDAVITTAARVGWGRLRSRPGTSSSIRVIAPAPTSPVTWVLAPACSATAVREPLVLTGKSLEEARRAMLAAPIPIISRFPSTSWPVRAANADEVEIVSVSDTTAMPIAPATSSARSDSATLGNVNGGKPLGQWADQGDAVVGQVEGVGGQDRDDHRHQHGGDLGDQPLEHEDQDQAEQTDRERRRHRLAVGQPLDEADRLGDEPVGVDREAEQLGELADQDREGEPVHVADLGRLGQQVGDEAQLGDAGEHGHRPRPAAPASRRARPPAAGPRWLRRGDDGGGDHGAERGVRPEHEDLGGAEDGVADQAQDRGVQPGDRRQARPARRRPSPAGPAARSGPARRPGPWRASCADTTTAGATRAPPNPPTP